MRIISNFHDYYDCLQATDEDKKTLYIRNPLEGPQLDYRKDWPFPKLGFHYRSIYVIKYIIGFCGKIYPLFKFEDYYPNSKTTFCWNADQVDKYLLDNLEAKELKSYLEKPYRKFVNRTGKIYHRSDIDTFFEECRKKQNSFLSLFEAQRSPIFVAERKESSSYNEFDMTYNAQLKPFQFFRIFDPCQAYQEITMFLNNLAIPLKPIPEIDDKTMAEAKGFNKYSFRKDAIRKRK